MRRVVRHSEPRRAGVFMPALCRARMNRLEILSGTDLLSRHVSDNGSLPADASAPDRTGTAGIFRPRPDCPKAGNCGPLASRLAMEVLGPMYWAALIVLFGYAELYT